MKNYDAGIIFVLIALFIGTLVAMVSVATNEGETPVHSTYADSNLGVS